MNNVTWQLRKLAKWENILYNIGSSKFCVLK
jgi:hypothetical protein